MLLNLLIVTDLLCITNIPVVRMLRPFYFMLAYQFFSRCICSDVCLPAFSSFPDDLSLLATESELYYVSAAQKYYGCFKRLPGTVASCSVSFKCRVKRCTLLMCGELFGLHVRRYYHSALHGLPVRMALLPKLPHGNTALAKVKPP